MPRGSHDTVFSFARIAQLPLSRIRPEQVHSMCQKIARPLMCRIDEVHHVVMRKVENTPRPGFESPRPTFFFPNHWSAISRELLGRLPSGLHRCADIGMLRRLRSLCSLWNIFVDSAVRKSVFKRTHVGFSCINGNQLADRLFMTMLYVLCIICDSAGPILV